MTSTNTYDEAWVKGSAPLWKKLLVWISITFATLALIGSFQPPYPSSWVGLGLEVAAMLLPGLWWLWCEHQDRKARATFAESVKFHQFLTEEDLRLVGEATPPRPRQRRWPLVALIALVLFAVGTTVDTAADASAPAAESVSRQ
ncbi:hypothetical protein [Corynebacterium uterequi]|uniref:Uncharacterized protein n=1 Tax=Corynebacterium uterequi TaxID=1072256 RepID=A0A0G3HA12_9CORY|nr:hypothetical protein [Corynebacterium uterequi]AKK10139.1 hypothetical protein CUTER_00570 [Corynebacterium uterequi]